MNSFRKFVAGSLAVLIPVVMIFTPVSTSAAKLLDRIPSGVETDGTNLNTTGDDSPAVTTPKIFRGNQYVKDTVKLKKVAQDLKNKMIKREPPAEPFFVRFVWGGATENAVWAEKEIPLISVNKGKIFVRKAIRLEENDQIYRKPIERLGKADTLRMDSEAAEDYDGVELVYWKPILADKEEIEFTFNSPIHSGTHTFKELQETPVWMENFDSNGSDFYADVRNYDTKRLEFNKSRTQLIFVDWGNVTAEKINTTNPEDYYRDYAVYLDMVNSKGTKIAVLGSVGLEEGTTTYQIDKLVAGGQQAAEKVKVLSTVEGLQDGLIIALEGDKESFGEAVLPFEQRGLRVQVVELADGSVVDRGEEEAVEEEVIEEETIEDETAVSSIVVVQASDEIVEEEVVEEEIIKDKIDSLIEDADLGEFAGASKKVVFNKVFTSGEQFGVFNFETDDENDPKYGIRVTSANFMYQNTPNALKAYTALMAAKGAKYWLMHSATPAKVTALVGLSALTASYVAAVQDSLFGEGYTCGAECAKALVKDIEKDVEQQKEALDPLMEELDQTDCDTVDCEEIVNEYIEENDIEELYQEGAEQVEQEVMKEVSEQSDKQEGYSEFSDVQQVIKVGTSYAGAWYYKFVQEGAAFGIVSGYADAARRGTYGPANNVNKAELLKMVTVASGLQPFIIDSIGEIEAGNVWYEFYINIWEAAAGLYEEAGNAELAAAMRAVAEDVKNNPAEPASRFDLAKYNVLGMRINPVDTCSKTSDTCENPKYFSDTTDKYVNYLANLGIVQGKTEGKYYGADLMNRAEAVKVEVEVAKYNGQTGEGEATAENYEE